MIYRKLLIESLGSNLGVVSKSAIEIRHIVTGMGRAAAPTPMIILPIQKSVQIDDLSTRKGQTWSLTKKILEQ